MTKSNQGDPVAAFNEVLSEVIDSIYEVKQAYRKVSSASELHDELGNLLNDLVSWKTLLGDRDLAMGVSALSFMSSADGRRPLNLWPGNPTFDEVRALVDEHLNQLANHLAAVLSQQVDEESRNALADVLRGMNAHRDVLARLIAVDG